MRLIKMLGLAALAAVAAMALVGATSASATATQLCTVHTGLTCGVASVHQILAAGQVGRLLAAISVLCLGFLVEATALGLASPQSVHSSTQTFTGCGTGSGHSDCTVSIPEGKQPLFDLLKTGLDEGTLTAVSGETRLKCPLFFGLDCLYDVEGMEFSVASGHLTATETPTTELGGKGLCPDAGLLDALLETLGSVYVLG